MPVPSLVLTRAYLAYMAEKTGLFGGSF